MRKIYKSKKILHTFILSVCLGASSMLSAQISGGTVTINGGSATGGTNYQTWADFRTALVGTTLTSALTVNVVTNITASGQISLPAITGGSSTNTITINGGGYFLEASVASDAVILFDGADYVTISNLIIRNTNATGPIGVRLQNSSDNNTIKNSTIEFNGITSASTTAGAYIAMSASGSSPRSTTSTDLGKNNTFDKNLMRTTNVNSPGPCVGIVLQGNTGTYNSNDHNNKATNNTIQNFAFIGVYMQYTNGCTVSGNDISRANATSYNSVSTLYGVVSQYTYSTSRSTTVSSNNVHDLPYVGANTSSAPSYIYGMQTSYNYGNATYRFTINSNTFKNNMSSAYIYIVNGNYNYYGDITSNTADNNDIPASSGYFYGFYNNYTYNSYKINSNTIKNCDGGLYWYGVAVQYAQSINGVQEMNDNVIDNNGNVYYSFYGIYTYQNNSSSSYRIKVQRNTITNNKQTVFGYNYNSGIYVYYYGYYDITDNTIKNNSYSSYYGYDIDAEYYGYYKIQRNNISGNTNNNSSGGLHAGIYSYYAYDLDVTDNLLVNNFGYYNSYGVQLQSYISGTFTCNVRQNTIVSNGSSSYYYHYAYPLYIYMYYHPKITVIGNIVDVSNTYYCYPAYTYNTNGSTPYTWNNNTYSIKNMSGGQYWYCPNGSASNFSGWAGLGFGGSGEATSDPTGNAFAGNYASNRFMNQNNVTTITSINDKDVYGVLRNPSSSDRGAVEGILDIQQTTNTFAPNATECAGYTTSPTVTFKNTFPETVTGFKVGCSDNGVLVATATMTASITTGGTGSVTFAPIKFSKSGSRTIKFFLLNADDVPSNDTIAKVFTINKAPGGGLLTKNSGSAAKALFLINGKPDVTTNGQAIMYDLTAPATVGYTNSQYGTKWIANVTAVDELANNANSQVSSNGAAPLVITVNPTLAFVDRTLTVSIKITDLASGCDTTYTRKVLVAPQAVPDFKLPALLCDKSDIYFDNTSTVSSGAILNDWDFGDGSPHVDATSPSHLYPGPGAYTVTYKAITSPWGYETTKTQVVNISDIPTANFKIVNACQGTAVKLTNATTIPSGVLSYSWNYGDGSPVFNTSSAATINKTYAVPNGYAVTLTATANGCSNSITKNVYTFARPVANFVKLQGNCDNELYNFKNASTIANGTFGNYWDFDDAGSKATVTDPSYDFTTAGTKNVKLKVVSEFGCADSITSAIVVKPASVSNFTHTPVCSRTPTAFTNTTAIPSGAAVTSYTWDFGDGTTTSATSPSKGWSSIGPKIVSLTTVLNNGCKDAVSKQVVVGVQPLVAFQVADQCAGSDVPFVNLTNYTQGNIKYTWTFGDNQGSSEGSPKHTYGGSSAVAQSYNVTLKGEVLGGCADSLTKVVTINPLPTACNFSMDRDYNTSLTAYKFTPIGTATGLTFSWITGDGNQVNTNGVGTSYSYQDKGKYCVTMIAKNSAGCECSSTKCATLTLGTENINLNKAISVFPNPTSSVFSVKVDATVTDVMVVNVYNTLGELVNTVSVNANTADVDMSNFASGIYVVKVISGNQIGTTKITVAK